MPNIVDRFTNLMCPACKGISFTEDSKGVCCTGCGAEYPIFDAKYLNMIPKDSPMHLAEVKVQDHVAKYYQNSRYCNPWSQRYHVWWTQLMLSSIACKGKILDDGCGIGELAGHLPDAELMGLDISHEMVRIAGTRYERVLLGDSQQLPFQDASFDAIVARSLLHHLPEPEKGLAEMARVLKPGGEVVAVDTNRSLLSTLPRTIANRGEHFSEAHKNFRRQELEALFSKHFKVEQVRFFGFAGYPVLGFPDLMNIFKFFPLKRISYALLMAFDETLARIPLIRLQAWAIMIKARKLGQ